MYGLLLLFLTIIIADIIAYYSKMSMTEVFLSNIAALEPVTLLRNGTPSWISSENCTKFFIMAVV